ncbi:hypothetical protein J6590_060078 [Homalodisca vitripennis]|nr:hypothetical protein J6590_101989 [Homalodisca vitripennis]KAG8320831.1 hypothetical protein J6590_060078 [Homalodisca vitripennis]
MANKSFGFFSEDSEVCKMADKLKKMIDRSIEDIKYDFMDVMDASKLDTKQFDQYHYGYYPDSNLEEEDEEQDEFKNLSMLPMDLDECPYEERASPPSPSLLKEFDPVWRSEKYKALPHYYPAHHPRQRPTQRRKLGGRKIKSKFMPKAPRLQTIREEPNCETPPSVLNDPTVDREAIRETELIMQQVLLRIDSLLKKYTGKGVNELRVWSESRL